MEGFAHTRLFEIALEEVKTVQRKPLKDRAEHALGDVEMEEAIDQVEDALVPFAMQHLFHWYIEENGKLPTWTEFTTWVTKTKKGVWLTRLHEYLRSHPDLQDTPRLAIGRAIHWRVGKFYYSAIREVELLVRRRLGSMILQ